MPEPMLPVAADLGLQLPCLLCGDACHLIADARLDEWVWVDDCGSTTGTSADLRPLGGVQGAYARLTWLAGECERLSRLSRKTKDGYCWPSEAMRAEYFARGREYSALHERLRWATFHVHHVRAGSVPRMEREVPCCCGWPAWLRPSGWQCRRCGQPIEPRG